MNSDTWHVNNCNDDLQALMRNENENRNLMQRENLRERKINYLRRKVNEGSVETHNREIETQKMRHVLTSFNSAHNFIKYHLWFFWAKSSFLVWSENFSFSTFNQIFSLRSFCMIKTAIFLNLFITIFIPTIDMSKIFNFLSLSEFITEKKYVWTIEHH